MADFFRGTNKNCSTVRLFVSELSAFTIFGLYG